MIKFKKGLALLPAFILLISGCTPKEDSIDTDESTPGDIETSEGAEKEDESTTSPETIYDSAYALYGDFSDSSWDESPLESSIYYLPYSTSDKSTMHWERTVTISSASQSWNAGFRVIEYGNWSKTVVSYSDLTSDSSGVIGMGSDNNICVNWGETYDLVIDCTGTSNKIKVTLVEEEIEVNIDSWYALYGDISGSSWDASPSKDSQYALPYDSTLAGSRYWTRTITTESPSYVPGFRIIEYGNYSSTVANNYNLDSASTGISSETDNDNNIKLDSKNTQYDITIDMRSSTPSILVNYHSNSFEAGIDGKYDDSSSGGSSSGGSSSGSGSWVSGSAFTGATVEKIDAIANNDNYIMGADMSSIEEVLDAGGVFYDLSGNKISTLDDFMKLLYDSGVNYVRIRLWNDPTDGTNSYGGGGNDLDTDLKIASAASSAGLKICLDFHYSDFWAHHGQQWAPKEWKSLTASGTNSRASTAAAWTSEVLTAFSNANATPSMVQVGNETNNNWISGYEGNSNAINFFKECCSAVRSFDKNIKIVIHYADDQTAQNYVNSYNSLVSGGVDFDVCGLSFYPYWHENGNLSSFKSTLQTVKNDVNGNKDVCLMEYSYGWTTDWTSWGTQYGNMSNTFNDSLVLSDYPATPQGQASCIRDINEVVSEVGGLGSFYWEPAWLSKPNTSWAFSASSSYYNDNGTSTSDYVFGTNTWANQALFDYNGNALQSLNVFNQMRNGVDYSSEKYVSGDLNVIGQVDTGSDRASQLPSSIAVYTSFDRTVYCDITWNSESLAALNSASDGSTITMSGTITIGGETLNVTATITLYHEYVVNGSFEEGTSDNVQAATGWSFKGSCGKPRCKDAAHSGSFYYDCWYGNAFTCGVYQTIEDVPAGTYILEVYYLLQNTTSLDMKLYATIDSLTSSITLDQGVVGSYVYQSLTFIVNTPSSVTIGMDAVGSAGACANLDDFSMYAVEV